jgi:hypothetical protein
LEHEAHEEIRRTRRESLYLVIPYMASLLMAVCRAVTKKAEASGPFFVVFDFFVFFVFQNLRLSDWQLPGAPR